jgi:hypothetical protein
MRNAETCLAIIRSRSERGLPIDDLYRQLFNPEFLRSKDLPTPPWMA